MFGFISKKKLTEEDLTKELLNSKINLNVLDEVYKKSDIKLDSLYYNDEPILIVCCKKDLYDSVVWLLKNRINLELENSLKETAIFYAIYSKDTKLLEILISFGANLNHLNKNNRTVLQESIHNSNNKIVRFLIKKFTIFTNCDNKGNNVLFDAVINGNMNIIKKLVSLKKIDLNHKNNAGNTILHLDNSLNNISLANYFLNQGADPTITNASYLSYLFHSITKGVEAIDFIIRASDLGFSLNLRNNENKNILMKAVEYFLKLPKSTQRDSQAELIKELVHRKINVQATNNENETIFFDITRSLDRDLIHYLLNNLENLNLNKQNIYGVTVLHILIINGLENNDLIKLYIEKGADLFYKNKKGKCIIEILIDIILHIENGISLEETYKNIIKSDENYKNILEYLIKTYEIDINSLNSREEPLFFPSLLNFNFSLFKSLRTKTLNLNAKDKNEQNIIFRILENDLINKNPNRRILLNTIKNLINAKIDLFSNNNIPILEFAIINDMEDIVKFLFDLKIDYSFVDEKGRNIVHKMLFKNREKYIKFLSSQDINLINQADYFGAKPINYAAFMGKKESVLELIKLGASINNPNKKSPSILEFLKSYHGNILKLAHRVEDPSDKTSLEKLASNMISEFGIRN